MKEAYILGLLTLFLVLGAVFIAQDVAIQPEVLLFPSKAWIDLALAITLPLILLLVAVVVNRYVSEKLYERMIVWSLALIFLVGGLWKTGADPILGAILISTWIGAVFAVMDSDPCRLRIKNVVSRPKLIATVLIVLFSVQHFAAYRSTLREEYIRQAIELIGPRVGNSFSLPFDANVTPQEREDLRKKLETYDWWKQLPPEDRERVFNEQLRIYADTKRAIVETLAGNMNLSSEQLEAALRTQIETMPIMQQLFGNIHYVVSFTVAIFYSFASLIAEVIAWVVGAIIAAILGPFPGQKRLT